MRIWKEIYELTKMTMDMGDSMKDITDQFWDDLRFYHDEYAEDILTEEKLFELAYDHYEAAENYQPVMCAIEWFRESIEQIIFSNFLEEEDKATLYIKKLWSYCLKHKLPTDLIIEMYEEMCELLSNEEIKSMIDRQKIEPITKEQKVTAKFLEWSGTKKHPKATEIIEEGLIKGNWFYRSNGTKKSINANGFMIIKEEN